MGMTRQWMDTMAKAETPTVVEAVLDGTNPDWRPLEALMGPNGCGDWMWMYRENGFEFYKNSMTRNYIALPSEVPNVRFAVWKFTTKRSGL